MNDVFHGKEARPTARKGLKKEFETNSRPNRVGQTLRKTDDRPYPELAANSEQNYERKQMKARLPAPLIKRISDFAKAAGEDRERCVEQALEEYLSKYDL